jgi:uncharacterized protein YxeA
MMMIIVLILMMMIITIIIKLPFLYPNEMSLNNPYFHFAKPLVRQNTI